MLEADDGFGSGDLPVAGTGEAQARFGVDTFETEAVADRRTTVEFEDVLAWGSRVGCDREVGLFERIWLGGIRSGWARGWARSWTRRWAGRSEERRVGKEC